MYKSFGSITFKELNIFLYAVSVFVSTQELGTQG